jgi:hypothetical protein
MRLPGFVHRKVKGGVASQPFRTRIIEVDEAAPAAKVEDFFTAGAASTANGSKSFSNGSSGPDAELLDEMAADVGQGVPEEETPAEKIRLALAVIPTDSREDRVNYARAIYRWSSGSEEGFALLAEWLATWPEFVEANVRRVWCSFRELNPPEQIITIASIFGRADQKDPSWRERWDEAKREALEVRCTQAWEDHVRGARHNDAIR